MTLTPTRPAPVEEITEIKPTEALKLGRLLYPVHGRGELADGAGAVCAIGAMLAGWGMDPRRYNCDYEVPYKTLRQRGVRDGMGLWRTYDDAEKLGRDGDAAVLAYLAERGL